jgi:hypothetical protein
MEYAIETLEIELNRCKSVLRQIDAGEISAMQNFPCRERYDQYIKRLESAIAKLKGE